MSDIGPENLQRTIPGKARRWPVVLAVVAGALVALVVAGLLVADSVLTSRARREAAALSQRLGRPVEVGGVAVKLLGGLGVRVSGVRIGAAAGEDLPLLEVKRVEVKAALQRALLSRGTDVRIRSAEIEGLHVNVVRLADGSTNVERLQKSLAAAPPVPAAAPAPVVPGPRDLSFLRVDRAALLGGRIAFVDRGRPGARELYVDQIDLMVTDLGARRPLDLLLRAAVLAGRQNLELRLHAAPLPPTLVPVVDTVVLKVEPVDLAPLAPFVPPSVGLKGGRLQAALEATLGAAVPGGAGPSRVRGGFRASGLAIRGGAPFDAALDADLEGDAGRGDLSISRLRLDLGPASLSGRGRVLGLAGGSPRVEGLEILSHGLDPARLAEYYPPLEKALGGQVSGPIVLSLRGAGSEARQALELRLDLTPVRLDFPGTLAKAPGGKMSFTARLRGAAAGEGALAFEASADLAGVDLRPGGQVAKSPGQRLGLALAGTRRAAKGEQTIDVTSAELLLPGDRVAGKASVTRGGAPGKMTTRFTAEAESDHLDLDRLLLPSLRGKGARPGAKPEKPPEAGAYAGLSGEARVRIGILKAKKVEARQVLAVVRVQGDQVTVEKGEASAFGGSLSAAGSRARLAGPEEPFLVKAAVQHVELEQALRAFTDKKIVSGTFEGAVDLRGGLGTPDLTKTLAGAISGTIRDGAFYGKDLVAAAAGPLARALPFGAAGKEGKGGATSLGKEQPFEVEIKDGFARLKKPIEVSRPEADLEVKGGFGLDGNLDSPVTVALSPQTIASISGGKARPAAPIPVSFRLTGPAWSPSISGMDLQPAVKAVVKEAGSAALGKALGVPGGKAEPKDLQKKAEEEAKKRLKGLFGR